MYPCSFAKKVMGFLDHVEFLVFFSLKQGACLSHCGHVFMTLGRQKQKQKSALAHNDWFWEFLSQNEPNLNFRYKQVQKSEKIKQPHIYVTFKIDIAKVQIFNSLVPKIEICLKYFLGKKSQKQALWSGRIIEIRVTRILYLTRAHC